MHFYTHFCRKFYILSVFEHIFQFVILVHMVFWVFVFARILLIKSENRLQARTHELVSIIVVFKNEWQNLQNLVPALENQTYPNFEIILMDDFSLDIPPRYMESILENKHIRCLTPSANVMGKKLALREAIMAAKGKYVLLTDGDCLPNSSFWVTSMIQQYHNPATQIVLGYSPYERQPSLLNKWIRYETWFTALQYMSYALIGQPYMGVGRNLSYKRELFIHHQNRIKNTSIPGGDDDLWINSIATSNNTAINIDPSAYISSIPCTTFASYIRQKSRHLSTSPYYKLTHKILLFIFAVSQILFWVITLMTLFMGNMSLLSIIVASLLIKTVIAGMSMSKFKEGDLTIWFPLMDFILAIYYLFMGIGMLRPSKSW